MEEERNLLDYVYVLVKWRRLIIVSVVAISLITAGISLVLPKAWTARTIIMPPEEDLDQFGLSALLSSAVPANLAGLVGGSTSAERLKIILETNRVLGVMVDRFGLIDEYEAPHREQAIELFRDHIDIELEQSGALIVEVTASDSVLAANLANDLVGELDSYNRQLKSRQARELREFLEERLELRRVGLEESGRALQKFQETNGLVDLETQTAAIVEVAKNIVLELALLEVKLGVISQQVSPEHEVRRQLELETGELRQQLQILIRDQADPPGRAGLSSLGPPLQSLPELGFEHAVLALDIEVKEEIIHFLGAKLEEAKYREALSTPTLQVLDPATPPRVRSAPRRTMMVLVAAFVSLVLSIVLAFVFESVAQLGVQNQAKIEAIKQLFRSRS